MDPNTVAALRSFTLDARAFLEQEASEQLEGLYGWIPGGDISPAKHYPALTAHAEAKETRRRLEQFLADEGAAGLNPKAARAKLVKEAAFTWLNRFVAFRLMEGSGLIKQTVSRGAESNAFKLWLTEAANAPWLAEYERGDLPKDEIGEGPRARAYRRFLLAQCARLAEEIRVLFDPDDLPSRLFPRAPALQRLVAAAGEEALAPAWAPGGEEAVGWIYQSFNARELESAFREARTSGRKFQKEDIASVTQLFTPRLAVSFLVENTLGRLWLEIHPDTRLAPGWTCLAQPPGAAGATPRLAREITFMDPACGTMHFGLVAFDLFAAMYQEEIARAGEPGWPATPSVASQQEIPAAIIANNLFGVDIDLRAVQLAALALYLRAKRLGPGAVIRDTNLAVGGVEVLGGRRLERFLAAAGFDEPAYEELTRAAWSELEAAEQLGSLLRPERIVESAVGSAKKARGPELPLFDGLWQNLAAAVAKSLDEFARGEAAAGRQATFFAGEGARGLRLLDLLARQYDVVATNPPYMSSRKMNPTLKGLVAKHFPSAKGDLYAAFVERCLELAGQGGRVGMLSMHSFMFISSYEPLRGRIAKRAAIEALAHFGPGLFAVGNPGTLQTAAYALRREPDAERRKEAVGTYFRLVKERDAQAKQKAFEESLVRLKSGQPDPRVFHYRQADFDAIPGSPWVYWITPGLRRLFKDSPQMASLCQPKIGMRTGDNPRFLRYWWEVGRGAVGFGAADAKGALRSGKGWFPYMKGGAFRRWYGNQDRVVRWAGDGEEIKENTRRQYPSLGENLGWKISNEGCYFRRGVTYSYLTAGRFSARLSPGGFIFDVAGSSLFPDDVPPTLAVMNSEFAAYALCLINPTVNFQVGDIARLPMPRLSSQALERLVNEAIALARADSEEDQTTYDFIAPPAWPGGAADVAARHTRLAEIERELNEEVYRLYGVGAEDRAAIERELAKNAGAPDERGEGEDNGEEGEDGGEEAEAAGAEGMGLAPEELARRWISYAVGVVLARFDVGKDGGLGRGRFPPKTNDALRQLAAPRGLLVQDPGHPDDFAHRVLAALRVMLGPDAADDAVHAATGTARPAEDALRDYLPRAFLKWHIQAYRKRPVYWLLESPARAYGVWLFHERLAKDTLLRVQADYLNPKIRRLEGELKGIKQKEENAAGTEKRRLKSQADTCMDLLNDLREFQKRLDDAVQGGYAPHRDDGVLLNLAPLRELIPAWSAEPRKAWQALQKGEYDWARQAMAYWPDRVRAKCKNNRSFAIAHGLEKAEAAGG